MHNFFPLGCSAIKDVVVLGWSNWDPSKKYTNRIESFNLKVNGLDLKVYGFGTKYTVLDKSYTVFCEMYMLLS